MQDDKTTQLDDDDEQQLEEEQIPSQQQTPKEVVSPIPYRALFIVLLVFIADSFSFTTLAPYITEFIIHLGVVPDGNTKKIGYYAGIIGSSYYVTQFFSAMIWGSISDRYGRRPVLLLGAAGSCICCFSFGFSTSIYWAVGTRALYGCLNGNLGVYKAYLAELSDKTNQAKVFSYLGVWFSFVTTL
jgi:MFS family permease